MSKPFKPLLASEADMENLRFPLLLSPKLDGVRAIVRGGKFYSRKLLEIPNGYVQYLLRNSAQKKLLENCDGELIVGSPTAKDVFHVTSGALRRKEGEPDFKFYIFDKIAEGRYEDRFLLPSLPLKVHPEALPSWANILPQRWIDTREELDRVEQMYLKQGYEGVMLRSPDGLYKYGRSTAKEGILLKLKRFKDAEAKIIGFEELQHNGNGAQKDNLGHTKRSSHKANLRGGNTLGALVVEAAPWGVFNIGTGFDDATRKDIWNNRSKYKGRLVKFKYQLVGTKDKPRQPSFQGFRDGYDT